MATKDDSLTISNFQVGVADSPLIGFAKLNNVEIFEKQGVARIQFGAALSFATASLPTAMVYDSIGNQYVGCLGGHIYKNGSLIGTGGGICDMAIISDSVTDPNGTYPIEYVLITKVDTSFTFYGPTYSASAAFAGGRSDLKSGHWKKISVGIDVSTNNTPYVYIGNGNAISAISNFASAGVGSPPTYSWNSAALTLQYGHYAYNLGQIGQFLVATTHGSPAGYTGAGNIKIAGAFYWNRTSPSYNIPTFFKENGISQLTQLQNTLYLGIGNRGRIYKTDSTTYTQAKRIPFCFNRQFGSLGLLYPNAATLHNGELITGISTQTGGGDANGNYGIYTTSLNPVQIGKDIIQYPTNMRNSISTGYTGNDASIPMQIGMVHSTGQDILFIGWQSGTSYGVDLIGSNLATNYTAVIESAYYTVGTKLQPTTYKTCEVALTAPLVLSQTIRISYRENLNDTSWTTIATLTASDFGTSNSFTFPANLKNKIKMQVRVEMTQPTTTPFGNNIELERATFYRDIN